MRCAAIVCSLFLYLGQTIIIIIKDTSYADAHATTADGNSLISHTASECKLLGGTTFSAAKRQPAANRRGARLFADAFQSVVTRARQGGKGGKKCNQLKYLRSLWCRCSRHWVCVAVALSGAALLLFRYVIMTTVRHAHAHFGLGKIFVFPSPVNICLWVTVHRTINSRAKCQRNANTIHRWWFFDGSVFLRRCRRNTLEVVYYYYFFIIHEMSAIIARWYANWKMRARRVGWRGSWAHLHFDNWTYGSHTEFMR